MNIYQRIRFCWSRKKKWIIRLFWLNILIWFWPVLLGHQVYKEIILPHEVSLASYQKPVITYEALPDTIKDTIHFYSYRFGIDENRMIKLIECESKGNPNRIGFEARVNLNSVGLLQFQPVTFYEYAGKYKIRNANIYDYRDQVLIASMMIRDNLIGKWTCGK